MATVATPRSRTFVGSFYITMAAIFAFVAFSGFFLTYWVPIARGTFSGSPMLHLHGLLFSLWTLFFLSQAILVANGGLRHHKAWGLAGISLATAMVLVGITVAVDGLGRRLELGYGDAARAFTFVPVSAVLLFGGLVAAAIANWRNPRTPPSGLCVGLRRRPCRPSVATIYCPDRGLVRGRRLPRAL